MPSDVPTPLELQHEIEQWYYREARLLDGREYQKWLALCDPEIRYVVPGRSNPLVDNARRGSEGMLAVENELEGRDSSGLPIRDESLPYLMLRVERAFSRIRGRRTRRRARAASSATSRWRPARPKRSRS